MAKDRLVLAGGSGFLGQALAARFCGPEHDVVVLSRHADQSAAASGKRDKAAGNQPSGVSYVAWDGVNLGPWAELLEGASALVNLTGKSINCRLTKSNREAIVRSRVDSVKVLTQAVRKCSEPPQLFVQTSAVGLYGDRGDELCDEATSPGRGFLAETCQAWEQAFHDTNLAGVRRVLLRLGVVLGKQGGVFPTLARLTKFFLGGRAGSGRQYISWIHIDDIVEVFARAMERPMMQGTFVACSPTPVTNAEIMTALRHALHRPWSPPAPRLAIQLGGWVAGANCDLVLMSQRCRPSRLLDDGFRFAYPDFASAVANLLKR